MAQQTEKYYVYLLFFQEKDKEQIALSSGSLRILGLRVDGAYTKSG